MDIKINGESIDLPQGFQIAIEDSSPVFNDVGSQSIPATVPTTRRNARIFGLPHRLDALGDPNNPRRRAELRAGAYTRRGLTNVTDASTGEGIMFNLGFDNAELYAKWSDRRLCDLQGLPEITPQYDTLDGRVGYLINRLNDVRLGVDIRSYSDPYAVFPIAVRADEVDSQGDDTATGAATRYEYLNRGVRAESRIIKRVIDGQDTDVTVPAGYGLTAFLRVWWVLERVFLDAGLTLRSNPFRSNSDLARLVVLNNCADACCAGTLRYADLMPDCTVKQFLNSLWVRFGLVYNIDASHFMADLRLLRDIIRSQGAKALDRWVAGTPKVTYSDPQYIKLSASVGIEGAEPACERWEDFVKGLDLSRVRRGFSVDEWRGPETPQQDWDRGDDDQRADYFADDDRESDEQPWEDQFDPDFSDDDWGADDWADGRDGRDDPDDWDDDRDNWDNDDMDWDYA